MAQLTQGRACSGEVRELAENIEAAQGPEIDTLHGWLDALGMRKCPPARHGWDGRWGHDHDPGDAMSGMMGEDEMDEIMAASAPSGTRVPEHDDRAPRRRRRDGTDEQENVVRYVVAVPLILFLLVLVCGAVTGRVRMRSCCSVADPSKDLRMRAGFTDERTPR